MSTKIYSGYILDEGMNPFEMINPLKEAFTAPIKRKIYESYLSEYLRLYDLHYYDNGAFSHLVTKEGTENKFNFSYAMSPMSSLSMMARENVEKDIKQEPQDYQVEVLFAQDPVTKRYLAYFLGTHDHEEKFASLPGISEFSYYNNADEPEDISYEDWQERGRTWERSAKLDEAMVNSMLSLQVISDFDRHCIGSIPEMMQFEPEFPSRDDRIHGLVSRILVENFFKANPDAKKNYSNIIKAQSDTVASNALWPVVESKLGENMTPELLAQKLKDSFKVSA